jgi:cardiolipin synthase
MHSNTVSRMHRPVTSPGVGGTARRSRLGLGFALALGLTIPAGAAAAGSAFAESSSTPASTVPADTLLTEPQQGYQPVYAFILSARRSLDMTMYQLSDPVAESDLAADSHRGVDVKVVLDQTYASVADNSAAYGYLRGNGVHVVWSNPGEIFHQKTITVDGAESLIMTGNLTSRYYATTRDFGVFDTRRADVAAIVSAFASDFGGHSPTAGRKSTDLVWSPGSQTELVALINSARHSVQVENEEMDSSAIESALEAAARRGVSVEVTMTYDPTWTRALDRLAAAGVKVELYHGEIPVYIHAKVISVDAGTPGQRAFIGSENFSTGSLEFNRELGLVTTDRAILNSLNATLTSDFAGSGGG